jgi:glycosidase
VVWLLTAFSAAPSFAVAPEVLKVEPPNWWVGHSWNPVRVMIRGRHLQGAGVEVRGGGVEVGLTRVNAAGTYLFVDLQLAAGAQPGSRTLRIVGRQGATEASFPLLAPLPRQGRFQGFSPDDVIYLLMPDRFANGDPANDEPAVSSGLLDRKKARYYHGGDLEGVIQRLPYLKDLGVTALWLNPWYDNHNRLNQIETYDNQPVTDYHGYGATDFYGVEERLGDLTALQRLVEAAHQWGLKVIQDQVANHTGPYHVWVKDPPTPSWYNGTQEKHLANVWQVWTLADPRATPEETKATLEGWFANILPDLNQSDEEVRRYLIQNTLWWVGATGLDGIRQDTWPYVPRDFWRDWMAAIKREYPTLTVVGEMWDGNAGLVSFFQGGTAGFDGVDTGVDTLFDFPLLYPLRRAFAEGKPLRELVQTLSLDRLYPRPEVLVTFLGNHDVQRFMNEPGASTTGLKLAFTALATVRGIPTVYYGDEIGMRGAGDPDNRRDFPGGWPDDAHNAFEASARTTEEREVFGHVRRVLRLRAELEPLRRGRLLNLQVEEQAWAFARVATAGSVLVAFNNAGSPASLDFDVRVAGLTDGATLVERLAGGPDARVAGGRLRLTLPPRSAAIYSLR